nr:hypothetical protein 1 [Mute swan feces associated picorna-like virus 20]
MAHDFIKIMSIEPRKTTGQTAIPPKIRSTTVNGNGKENFYLKKKDGKRRDEWKLSQHNNRRKYKPQSGFENISALNNVLCDLSSFAGVEAPEKAIRYVEGIVALLLNLQDCKSVQGFSSAVFLYVRDFVDSSMTTVVMNYIQELMSISSFDKQSDGEPAWIDFIREAHTNWSLIKGNKMFKQFSKLLGILVTLGLCEASSLTFSVHGFKMFDEKLLDRHMTAYDLTDAIFGTVTYFAEGTYLCFKTGSLKPLLMNDFAVLELDEEYLRILCWWDLVKNGNLERFEGVSDSEFSRRLESLICQLRNITSSLTGFDKKLVQDKIAKCSLIKNDYIASKVSSGVRRSPFSIELFGASSQGKTTFGDQLLDSLLTSADLPVDKEYRAALNAGDKFFSNWTSDKLVAILDDLCNEKSDFVERPPTRAIIDICNNQMYYAPKAELEAKGKCFVEPEIMMVTTNTKNLDAGAYSKCPYSIQRRMHLVMSVHCKDEFQRHSRNGRPCGLDSRKVREHYTKDGVFSPEPIDNDVWTITIEQAVAPEDQKSYGFYEPFVWRGKEMIHVTPATAIACAIEVMHEHRTNQFSLMDAMRIRNKCMEKCSHPGCIHMKGYCPDHQEFDKQFGIATVIAARTIKRKFFNRFRRDRENLLDKVENVATDFLYKKTNEFLDRWDWICLVPEEYLDNKYFLDFVYWYYKEDIVKRSLRFKWSSLTGVLLLCWISLPVGFTAMIILWLFGFMMNTSRTKCELVKELKDRNDSLPLIIRNSRDKYAKAVCYGSAALAGLYLMSRVYRAWKKAQPTQSALEPRNQQEIAERDAAPNVWASVQKRTLPTAVQSGSISGSVLAELVSRNMRYARVFVRDNRVLMANVCFLKSNLLVIPDHYFEEDTLRLTCFKENPEAGGGKFDTRLCKSSSYLVPGTDLRVCYSPSGGSYRDLTKFFPNGSLVDHPFLLQWRSKDGSMIDAQGYAIAKKTSNGTCLFDGGEYAKLSINTFNGMCGAVVVSDTKTGVITGFHLGGIDGKPQGCFGCLTKQQLEVAYEHLRSCEGVLLTGTAEQFTPQVLGKDIVLSTPLHPKSPMNYLPPDSQFEYYGSCPGQVSSYSDVKCTPISEHVSDICAVENIWGAPKMKPEWFGWQTCLANASLAGKAFPHDLLVKSIVDYKRPLLKLIKSSEWNIKPLSNHDNLNGIPGCRFIDAINLSTSIGYPLTGPKTNFVENIDPDENGVLHRKFTDVIQNEINRVEACYRRGERAFTIAKACKKDEILPIAKEKCRIFYGNPIALTFLVRKYFLPVLRFLQMNPLVSECAVGINCHGPEWDEFYNHAISYGKERLFGGDYGKYDQKLPSQLLIAALRILIDLAREKDYAEDDLKVMETMAGDLVFSLIAFNGDLVGLQEGTHISGNSLTVILNGICGSLNLRNYFYSKYPASVNFRDAAHMMTYGDDNIGSVHPDYPDFNIKGCSEFLATYGQIYTMPDKESELREYLEPGEFEFLKRFSVYHPKLDRHIGALLDKSVFKSLHCYMRGKGNPNSPNEACALNIDTALREWFNHGEDVYEMRRKQMTEVARRADIAHMCTLLDETYDDRVANWEYTYTDIEKPDDVVVDFSTQSGSEATVSTVDDAVMEQIPMNLIGHNVPVIQLNIGEIDLLFEALYNGRRVFVLVETKDGHGQRAKGRKQVKKYCEVLQILQPDAVILGILVAGSGWHNVYMTHNYRSTWLHFLNQDEDKWGPFKACICRALATYV